VEEKKRKKKFNTTISEKAIEGLKKMCSKHGISQNVLVEGAITREVARLEKLKSNI